jgi:hypothetical protein
VELLTPMPQVENPTALSPSVFAPAVVVSSPVNRGQH